MMEYKDYLKIACQTALGTIALYAGACAKISFFSVPYTLQTLALMVNSTCLGGKASFLSTFSYLLLGISGLNVFANGATGLNAFNAPDGGYLLGFLGSTLIYYAMKNWIGQNSILKRAAGYATMDLTIISCGIMGLLRDYNLGQSLEEGLLLFIPGEIVKIMLACLVTEGFIRFKRRTEAQEYIAITDQAAQLLTP